jgi:hypothetical protein
MIVDEGGESIDGMSPASSADAALYGGLRDPDCFRSRSEMPRSLAWLQDLPSLNPYWVLPIMMCATMVAQQALTPSTVDPVQKKIGYIMPLIFTGSEGGAGRACSLLDGEQPGKGSFSSL